MRLYFLKSERLGFSKWEKEDLELAVGLWGDYNVTQLLDSRGKLSKEQVKERLEKELNLEKEYGVQYWPIFNLKTEEHIGCCGLRPYDLSNNIMEIGFHLKKAHWGQGYAYEAAQRVIAYVFSETNCRGLFAGHNPMNIGSRKLLEKLGFVYTHEEYYPGTGLHHPSYILNHSRTM
ncbi:GNAT family N-acetyltransferase [Vallitalea okinawensis]|uniref:GNAT family N-acetyltransferase n=1 Tax=Vallitalea okinawensis TaxID=2078660 RepID=UPI000CFAAF09|nr:GNAT family N-acetyltransferase [Vallitalea okinawensis]